MAAPTFTHTPTLPPASPTSLATPTPIGNSGEIAYHSSTTSGQEDIYLLKFGDVQPINLTNAEGADIT
ncbi:MAG: hypothetical protein AAB658_03290, partial [Chloroflexota bacterium]